MDHSNHQNNILAYKVILFIKLRVLISSFNKSFTSGCMGYGSTGLLRIRKHAHQTFISLSQLCTPPATGGVMVTG